MCGKYVFLLGNCATYSLSSNIAVFPDDSGQFRPSQVTDGVTYEVHGDSTCTMDKTVM